MKEDWELKVEISLISGDFLFPGHYAIIKGKKTNRNNSYHTSTCLPFCFFQVLTYPLPLWAAVTEHHRLGAHKQQMLISYSSEGCKSDIRMPDDLLSRLLVESPCGGRGEGSPRGLLYQGTNPIVKAPPPLT